MLATGMPPPRCARQQQRIGRHDAVDALDVHAGQPAGRALPVHQGASAPVAIARQLSDLLADVLQQLFVTGRRAALAAVAPAARPVLQRVDVRARQPQCLADRLEGKGTASLPPPPRGTGRATFTASGSGTSLRRRSHRWSFSRMRSGR